jgi:aspartokinase-like uncharacterized kinase
MVILVPQSEIHWDNFSFSKMLLAMMYTLKDIVLSQLFLNPECRAILLPSILSQVRDMLDHSNEVGEGMIDVKLINIIYFALDIRC